MPSETSHFSMLTFIEDGVQTALMSLADCKQAIVKGRIDPDTRVIVFFDRGDPVRAIAGEAPALAHLFSEPSVPTPPVAPPLQTEALPHPETIIEVMPPAADPESLPDFAPVMVPVREENQHRGALAIGVACCLFIALLLVGARLSSWIPAQDGSKNTVAMNETVEASPVAQPPASSQAVPETSTPPPDALMQASPSFSCNAALSYVEQQICASASLADFDQRLAALYRSAIARTSGAERRTLRQSQRAWLFDRNACADPSCIEPIYRDRIALLESLNSELTSQADQTVSW